MSFTSTVYSFALKEKLSKLFSLYHIAKKQFHIHKYHFFINLLLTPYGA